jgi:indole-3-glycerol phosphate synthase
MSILDKIVAQKRLDVKKLPFYSDANASRRDFMQIFDQFAVIAELKSKSPSEGMIVENYQPVKIAKLYEQGAANAISVLTDTPFFNGSFDNLATVRQAVDLPLLCKDFIIDDRQIYAARHAGADACLLIMSILTDDEYSHLKGLIESLNMVAVIEVYDHFEVIRALRELPQVVLVNNRNLHEFSVDLSHSHEMADVIPPTVKLIIASGVTQPEDIKQLPERADGVLIGTALMRSENKLAFLKALHDES